MLITIDIGNTQTVIGLYRYSSDADPGDIDYLREPSHTFRIATNKNDAPGDIQYKLTALFHSVGFDFKCVKKAVYASVVPALSRCWECVIENLFDTHALRCTYDAAFALGLFRADYPNPKEIGADRIADAIAVRKIYASTSIVVDFGTATNFEIVDSSGCFLGGIIAPGIMTGSDALFAHATKLAETDMTAPLSVIGKSTAEAIQSGIIYGEVARVDGLIRRIKGELWEAGESQDASVVATGGLAELVAEHSSEITDVRGDLTLIGLRLLAEADRL